MITGREMSQQEKEFIVWLDILWFDVVLSVTEEALNEILNSLKQYH